MRAKSLAVTFALICGAAAPAIAGPAINTNFPADPTAPAGPVCATSCDYGFSFLLLNSSEIIQGLGAYNGGGAGLTAPAEVGLWDSSGELLASTTVPAGNAATVIGDFSFNGITPVTLDKLTLYYVASYQPSDPITTFQISDYTSPPVDSNVIVNADAYGIGTGLVFPDQTVGFAGAELGANFTSQAIPIATDLPEPATLAILASSVAGFLVSRRRTARKR
jgi:Domain of unknown function (DUF4082)/PEP-CTERM motif